MTSERSSRSARVVSILRTDGLWSVHVDGELMLECFRLWEAGDAVRQIAKALRVQGCAVEIAEVSPAHV